MILSFSGTGNSRFVADKIAELTGDEIVDLNEKIKNSDYSPIYTGGKTVISVPTYAWRIPKIVEDFLLKTELPDTEKVWFVMTCGGEIGNAEKYNKQLCEKIGSEYMGSIGIVMPENYLAMFSVPTREQGQKIINRAIPKIEQIALTISEDKSFPIPRNNIYDKFMSSAVNPLFYTLFVKSDAFFATSECNGCGLCAKKCPLNNIVLADGKPVWSKDCTHCMACIAYCPKKAIEYGKKSEGKPRYHF